MPKHAMKIHLSADITVKKDGDGFHASCPSFSWVHAYGKSEKEAVEGARDGIIASVLSLQKHNEPIPCCTVIEEDMVQEEADIPKHIFRENIPISIPCMA